MHGVGSPSSKRTCLLSVFPGAQCPRVRMASVAFSRVESPGGQEEGTWDKAVERLSVSSGVRAANLAGWGAGRNVTGKVA